MVFHPSPRSISGERSHPVKVLVTGGTGYIGSHTAVELFNAGHEPVMADNLVNSFESAAEGVSALTGGKVPFEKIDLCDLGALRLLFKKYRFDAVIHFAALKAVGESVKKPLEYYRNNLVSTLNLLTCMRESGVGRLVFSSSACVYGEQKVFPIPEEASSSVKTENPYGTTKVMIERIINDCAAADHSFSAAVLRYFNPIGAHPSGLIGENPRGVPQNLMPRLADAALGKTEGITIYGNDYPTKDGTCIRDYIHVVDLARGHVLALEWLSSNTGVLTCNLGSGTGYSVLEIVTAYSEACGRQIKTMMMPRRAGDVPVLIADCSRAQKVLGWKARKSLREMCEDSWRWTLRMSGS